MATRISAPLGVLLERYHMTVEEAEQVICPCGHSQGRKMSELGRKNVHWFATRKTRMSQSREFRMAVKAARILRAYRLGDQRATVVPDAKRAHVMCVECGVKSIVSRRYLDARAALRCYRCGGRLHENTARRITVAKNEEPEPEPVTRKRKRAAKPVKGNHERSDAR